MLEDCPKFVGSPSEYTNEGTKRHKALAAYLGGKEQALDVFLEDVRDNLMWAADYIKLKAPLKDHPLGIEMTQSGTLPNGIKLEGTPDFICGKHIFDLKWRPRDYRAQMAAYAYMRMDGGEFDEITSHLLFGEMQSHREHKWTVDSAWTLMKGIIEQVKAPFAAPTPCDYCGWCAKKLKCEALIQQVNLALASNPEWELEQWHSSEMVTAKEIGMALKIARTLKDWCESVEFHAKEMASKQGVVAEGFELKSRQGNRFIADIGGAFTSVNLPQPDFLKACVVKPRLLFDIYAEFHGMKKAPAERDVVSKLGAFIQRKSSFVMLTAKKPSKKK